MLYQTSWINTGHILSQFLFSFLQQIVKADVTVLTGQITDNDNNHFQQYIDNCVQWCVQNYLELNVCKAKEMFTDLTRYTTVFDSVVIKGVDVKRVETKVSRDRLW
jgi:hypothetical protein